MKTIFFSFGLTFLIIFAVWGLNQDNISREKHYQENYNDYCESRSSVELQNMESRCIKYFFKD